MAQGYVVGVDVGTGSARAGVFSATDGGRLATASHPIRMWRPRTDHAEHSSRDIWESVGVAVRTAVSQAGIQPDTVIGIAFDATCSLVVLGSADDPVTVSPEGDDDRNVIVWMDHRAIAEADEINAGSHDVLRYVGGAISPEMQPPKLLWIKRNLPSSWARAAKCFDLADFLAYAASGRDVRSLCTNVCKWTYLGHEDRWDTDFLESIGLGDLFEGGRIAGPVRPLGEAIGPLTADAARHLGLTRNCIVGVGAIDAHAGGIGLLGGSIDPGRPETVLALIGGTSNCHMAASREPIFVPGVWGPYYGAMVPGLWLTEGGQSAAGSLIDHAIESGADHAAVLADATASGRTVYEVLNERIDALVHAQGLGDPALLTRDLHVLDFHLGNRSPYADPHARGVVDGLPLDRNAETDARMVVATIEAVAYGTRAIVEALCAEGFAIERIVATGGGTKNPLWLRLHADATGLPITVGRETESVLLGSAMLAAAASGAHPSVADAMAAMGGTGDTLSPNPDMRRFHDAKYAVWKDLYAAQKRHRALMAETEES
ncbi:MAG: FGGY-family carbohydrate kinase [Armatimonadota bacterium]